MSIRGVEKLPPAHRAGGSEGSGVQEGVVQAAQAAQHGLFHGLEDVLITDAACELLIISFFTLLMEPTRSCLRLVP